MYLLADGTEVTADDIRAAYNEGKAVVVHQRVYEHTSSSLRLDGVHFDTRDRCYQMCEEAWTREPKNLREALRAAYCRQAW